MANIDPYRLIQPGGLNGGNSRLWKLLKTDQLPWAFAPDLAFEHKVTFKDLRTSTDVAQSDAFLVGGTIVAGDHEITFTDARTGVAITTLNYVVHEDTVTIGGTASDGNYDTVFDALDPPVRVRTVRATTPATNDNIATQHAADITDLIATSLNGIVASASANASVVTIVYEAGIDPQTLTCTETTATGTITPSVSATASTVAAGLEALIQAARGVGEALEDYVEGETVDTATITIDYVDGVQVLLTDDFPGTSTGTTTTTNVATIDMGQTGDWYPSDVIVDGGYINRLVAFAGGTPTITIEVGDTNDPNGLVTSTSIATTGPAETTGAAEHAEHLETAFAPTVTITSNQPFTSLTAGEVLAVVRYTPVPNFE